MFRLLRVFSLTSAVAILLVTAALVALYRQNAVRNLVETEQSENAMLARSFAGTIWPRLSSFVGSASELDGDALRARAKTWRIREAAQVLSNGRPVLKVNIYTTSGFNVFSSHASEIGEDESGQPGFFTTARDGKATSRLVHKDAIEAFAGTLFHRDVVESYFPIRKGDGPIEGVIELYTDATPFMAMIDRTTVQLVGGLVLVLGLSYGVLFLVVRRAGRALAREHAELEREVAERRRMEEDLRRSEALLRGAVNSLQEGFALFDAEDRLVLINDAYLSVNPSAPDIRDRGLRYEDLLRANIERGMIAEAVGREEDFVRERLERHRNPGDPILRRFTDGKWCLIKEARTPDGGTALTFTDVTELKRAEEALLQAKRQNDMILEAAGEGIYGLDLEGRTTFINPAAAKMIGWEPEDLIGRPQHDILHHTRPDGTPYPRDECPIYAAFTDGQVHHVRDEVFWRKDGTSFPVEYVSTPIRVKGEILGAVVVFTDITERKKAEDALRVSEARMRDLVECTSDWIWHMDAELRFSYFSDRFEEVTGIRAEDLLGKTRRELGQGDTDDEKWRRHLADLEAHRPFRDFQYKFVHPDGRTLHFLVNGKPLFDEAGAFLGYRGVGTDITARVEAEEQARSARERLALAVDGLSELFALFDADDRIVLTNAAWREMNRDIAEVAGPGTRFEDFLRAAVEAGLIPEAVGREEEWLRWRIDLHRNPQGPFEIQRQNGRWILINEQRLPDGGTVLIVSDVTERKRAEEALRETERRFRNLVDGSVQGILIHQDRRPVYVNRAWAEIHGYTVAEVLAMDSVIPLIAPSEHARMAKYRKRRMEGGEAPSWYEYEAVRKDGTHIWLENMATVVTWKDEPAIQSTIVDITERKRAEEAVRRSEERLRGAVESLQEGFALFDAEDRLVLINDEYRRVNPVAQEMLEKGLRYEDVLRANVKRGMIVEAIGREDEFIRERLHRHRNPTGPILRQFTNGMWYLIKEARTPEGGIALTFVDITKQKMIEEQIRRQANYDSLTDLPNRTLFMDRLSRALVAARRDNELVALLFIDLDRFKVVNDTLGHVVGDRLLEKAAERLRGCVREVDTVARLGGDEFTIILQNIAKPEDAAVVAQKVIESLAAPFSLENHEAFIGASIGITVFPTDADNASTLLRNADVAMYRAKDAGRNEYRFFTKEMDAHALTRLSLENDLRYALEREQFFVHYQPIVDLQSGGVVSAEALVRWRHPRRGLVPPDEFIPLAEESGLIAPLGEWVLRTACAQAGTWQNMDLPAFGISVNLSSGQLKRGLSHEFIARVLRDAGISPELLTFEITESLIMEDTNEAITWLHAVKDMGVSLSIDDFGTGYSSLSYLKRFPVDSVKIDRSFVGDVTDDPEDASLADAIIALAHNLGLTVIAEGVETKEQLAFLQARGCDLYQGYYFGKPMTAGELEERIRNDRWSEFSGSTPPSPRPAKRRDAGTRRRPARRARGKDQAASPSARGRSLQSKKRP